jgi:hypothetical protein
MIRITLALLALVLAHDAALAQQWRTYANPRFGVTADVPRDWRAGRPPANGDGLKFASPDGQASIMISGGLQIEDTLEEAMQSHAEPLEGETVTYRHRDGRTLVVSGTRGATIFYRKSLLSCADQIWNNVSIEYPAARKAAFDALVIHVAGSLRSGTSEQIPKCR